MVFVFHNMDAYILGMLLFRNITLFLFFLNAVCFMIFFLCIIYNIIRLKVKLAESTYFGCLKPS